MTGALIFVSIKLWTENAIFQTVKFCDLMLLKDGRWNFSRTVQTVKFGDLKSFMGGSREFCQEGPNLLNFVKGAKFKGNAT